MSIAYYYKVNGALQNNTTQSVTTCHASITPINIKINNNKVYMHILTYKNKL